MTSKLTWNFEQLLYGCQKVSSNFQVCYPALKIWFLNSRCLVARLKVVRDEYLESMYLSSRQSDTFPFHFIIVCRHHVECCCCCFGGEKYQFSLLLPLSYKNEIEKKNIIKLKFIAFRFPLKNISSFATVVPSCS